VQTLGSNKALEFLNAGSIDFGSTAGSAALLGKINGNPIKAIYVYSKPEWTALVTRKDTNIKTIADLKGKRVAVTRGTDPHIFLVRALQKAGLSEKDIQPVLLQHPDGATALIRGDVDAWAGLDPMMAAAQVEEGARLFYRNKAANTWGILNSSEDFLKAYPDLTKRVLAAFVPDRQGIGPRRIQRIAEGLGARMAEIAQTVAGEVGMPLNLSTPIQAGMPIQNWSAIAGILDSFEFEAVPMISKAHVMAICAGDSWIGKGANLLLIGGPGISDGGGVFVERSAP